MSINYDWGYDYFVIFSSAFNAASPAGLQKLLFLGATLWRAHIMKPGPDKNEGPND